VLLVTLPFLLLATCAVVVAPASALIVTGPRGEAGVRFEPRSAARTSLRFRAEPKGEAEVCSRARLMGDVVWPRPHAYP